MLLLVMSMVATATSSPHEAALADARARAERFEGAACVAARAASNFSAWQRMTQLRPQRSEAPWWGFQEVIAVAGARGVLGARDEDATLLQYVRNQKVMSTWISARLARVGGARGHELVFAPFRGSAFAADGLHGRARGAVACNRRRDAPPPPPPPRVRI